MEEITDIQFIEALVDRHGNDVHKASIKSIRKKLEEIQEAPNTEIPTKSPLVTAHATQINGTVHFKIDGVLNG